MKKYIIVNYSTSIICLFLSTKSFFSYSEILFLVLFFTFVSMGSVGLALSASDGRRNKNVT